MTSQTITIRVTANECWFVDRISRDDRQPLWKAEVNDWFDVLGARWMVAYSEVSPCLKVPYQFVVRCQPIEC
jgi:hypothetical protein